MTTIVAMLTVGGSFFYWPSEKEIHSDSAR